MASLLTLPRELRDEIIDQAISSTSIPPTAPTQDCQRVQFNDINYHCWFGDNGVKYETTPDSYVTTSVGLLLTNHQLHMETADRMADNRPINYNLDVMLVNGRELWPTWTSLPAPSTRINTVTATFRIFGHWTRGSGGDGGPPLISWSFYSLLERFLKVGPVGLAGDGHRTRDRGITIRLLQIDIQTSTDMPEVHELASAAGCVGDKPFTGTSKAKKPVKDPQELYRFLASMIGILLYMSYHTAIFGAILYERVGTIRISLDGEVQKEWDLADLLANFPIDGPPETFCKGRQANFRMWRERTLELREQARLPVRRPTFEVEESVET